MWREKWLKKRFWILKESILLIVLDIYPSWEQVLTLPLKRCIYSRGTVTFMPGIFVNPVVQYRTDGFIVKLYKTMCIVLSLLWTPQIPKKETSWFVLINNIIRCLHFWSSLYCSVLFGKVTAMGVCYLDLLWRCHDNSKCGWWKQRRPAITVCCEISHARGDTLRWDWHFQGCRWWWLRVLFLDFTSGGDGSSLGSLSCLDLSCVGFIGRLHHCPR